MVRPNFDNDEFFLDLINEERLILNDDGTVYNPITRRNIGYYINALLPQLVEGSASNTDRV